MRPGCERGSVLVYVVFIMLLLSLFASAVGSQALYAVEFSERLTEQLRATYIARGAIQPAAVLLERDMTPSVDGLTDAWVDQPGLLLEQSVAGGWFTITSGDVVGGTPRYGLADEERRLNLNTAPAEVLERLAEQVGALREQDALAVAAAIEDWRDEDSQQRPSGAEGFTYRSFEDPYDCKDGPFESTEELQLVKGMSPALYQELSPYVTVYGSGQVNLNTASPTVLRALGLSEAGVAGVERFRAGEDNQTFTGDDRHLVSIGGLEAEWTPYVPVEELAHLKQLAVAKVLTTRSTAFRLHVSARTAHPASRVDVSCVIDRQGRILAWAEP